VLALLCQQHSNAEIAKKLSISELTVKRHRQDLLERTGSKNLAGLIIYAIENNIYSIKKTL
jgi:DNA-binding CsgD family transcriptional regulator